MFGQLTLQLFLTSDDAAFISGEAIVVDGGQDRIGWGYWWKDVLYTWLVSPEQEQLVCDALVDLG
ncbi:MAG: hypothetical protein C5B51_20155, partial [Terriglobia bacterium]